MEEVRIRMKADVCTTDSHTETKIDARTLTPTHTAQTVV